MTGQHHVVQDGAGASQITPTDLATFKQLKAAADYPLGTVEARTAAFQFIISKRHTGLDGKPLQVGEDMRQHYSTYGFASTTEAAGFIAWVEQK